MYVLIWNVTAMHAVNAQNPGPEVIGSNTISVTNVCCRVCVLIQEHLDPISSLHPGIQMGSCEGSVEMCEWEAKNIVLQPEWYAP